MASESSSAKTVETRSPSSEQRIMTRSGRPFWVRPIAPADEDRYSEMISELKPSDRRFRFFSALQTLPEAMLHDLVYVDHDHHEAFVALPAEGGGDQPIAGVVRLIDTETPGHGEFAVVVADRYRGFGLGFSLMRFIIGFARGKGLDFVDGAVLSENRSMLDLCKDLGFRSRLSPHDASVALVEICLREER